MTLSLVFGAAFLWVTMAILVGVVAAVKRGTFWDPLLMIIALIGISMPVFWLGEVANLVTQSRYHDTFLFSWVPPLGYTPLTQDPFMWFKHLVIPWIVLAVLYIGFYGRVLRADLVESENNDFVRTARAKGLDGKRVMTRHQLRNSMVVFISLFGLDFGALVGGAALLTEVVFGLPGVGRLTYNALDRTRSSCDHGHRHLRCLLHRARKRDRRCRVRVPRPAAATALGTPMAEPLLDVRDLKVTFRTEDGSGAGGGWLVVYGRSG